MKMQIASIASTLATGILLATTAQASGLLAPFALDSAQVMPKGVRSLRFSGFSTTVGEKFDGGGTIVPLANDINKPITIRQLADSQPKGFDRGSFKGGMESYGFNLDDVVGQANGSVNTRLTTTVPVIAWGATNKLTLAIAAPIIYSNLNVSTGWTSNATMQKLVTTAQSKGLGAKIMANEAMMTNVVDAKLQMLGYKSLVSETHTDFGDMTFLAKYQLAKGDRYAWSIQPRVVAPTGREADPNKVIDLAGGDGHWDAGLGTSVDYVFTPKFISTVGVGYLYQFASTKTKHLPNSWDDSLSADVDSDITAKQGDIMGGSAGARWAFHPVFTLGAQYSYQYKLPDSYSGSKFESERYGYLAKDSQQRMQAAQIALSISTIDLFLKKKFVAPFEVNLGYTAVLEAQNTVYANLTSLEFVSYF